MRTVNPFPAVADADEGATTSRDANSLTYSAERVLVGLCPNCGTVLVLFNDHEPWPLFACACGWRGDTLSLPTQRTEGVRYAPRPGDVREPNPEPDDAS